MLILLLLLNIEIKADTIAILGDSISAATMFEPNTMLNYTNFKNLIKTKLKKNTDFKILWPSFLEYSRGTLWVMHNVENIFLNIFFNNKKYGFAYLLSQNLKIDTANIYITAFTNARYDSLPKQALRLIEQNNILPSKIIIFLSGIDVCAGSINLIPSQKQYSTYLKNTLDLLIKFVNNQINTQIILIDPINYHQIAYDSKILEKKITIFNEKHTCSSLQQHNKIISHLIKTNNYYWLIPPDVLGLCPTLFSKNNKNLNYIANKLREWRKENDKLINNFKNKYKKATNIHFLHLKNTQYFNLEPQDIADNCLLLSEKGHKKLADFILLELSQKG